MLGLFQAAPGRDGDVDPALRAKIDSLVGLRQAARQRRDFAEADRIRDELLGLGAVLEDTRGGTVWKLRR